MQQTQATLGPIAQFFNWVFNGMLLLLLECVCAYEANSNSQHWIIMSGADCSTAQFQWIFFVNIRLSRFHLYSGFNIKIVINWFLNLNNTEHGTLNSSFVYEWNKIVDAYIRITGQSNFPPTYTAKIPHIRNLLIILSATFIKPCHIWRDHNIPFF